MIAIITVLTIIILSLLITRIATVILIHTGLAKDIAQFQARSAFTGVGFTTLEAEKVVNHPVRRRVIMVLMLFGNAGIVTVMSSLVISFVGIHGARAYLHRIVLLGLGLAVMWRIATSHWVDHHLSNLIARALKRYTSLDVMDYTSLLHLGREYRVIEFKVEPEHWLANRSLADVRLPDHKIQVLGMARANGEYIGAPDGDTVIRPGDVLTLYGQKPVVERMNWTEEPPCITGKAKVCRPVANREDGESTG